MAYSATGFSTIAASKKGNSISLYAYTTADAIGDVNTSGYFNALAEHSRSGRYHLHPHLDRWHYRNVDRLRCLERLWRCGRDRWHDHHRDGHGLIWAGRLRSPPLSIVRE
jgi:hypothetical protein